VQEDFLEQFTISWPCNIRGIDIIAFDFYLAPLHFVSQSRFSYYLCTSQIKGTILGLD
jgi:hypothetical protein